MCMSESAYTKIPNNLLEQLATVKLSPTQYRLLFVIWRYTYGFHRDKHELSLTFLATATGCDKRQIQRELKGLDDIGLIKQEITGGKSARTIHSIGEITIDNSTIGETTNGENIEGGVGETTNSTIGETTNQERKKEKYKEIYCAAINHLNKKAGTNYKPTTKATQQLINARLNDGFTEVDFITVIDKKVAEWRGTDMAKYLRPVTLFGTKFESYLNQSVSGTNSNGGNSHPEGFEVIR